MLNLNTVFKNKQTHCICLNMNIYKVKPDYYYSIIAQDGGGRNVNVNVTHILSKIIDWLDQTSFIQRRQTQDNICWTLHVIKHIKKLAVLLSLDAEKAFDLVSWEFLHSIFGKFEFHQTFTKTIKGLYKAQVI